MDIHLFLFEQLCAPVLEQATEYEEDLEPMEYTPPEETNRRQRQRELEAAAAERETKVCEAKRSVPPCTTAKRSMARHLSLLLTCP